MASPTETVQVTSNIPEWAKPYAERLLGEAEKLSRRGFQPYTGQMVEEFNPLQEQAFLDIAGMRPSSQLSQATGLAGLAGLRAQQAGQYRPMQPQQYYQSPFEQRPSNPFEQGGSAFEQDMRDRLRNTEINRSLAASRSTSSLEPTSPLGGEGYGPLTLPSQSFQPGIPGGLSQYMSPYMQGVVEQQKSQAISDYGRQLPGMAAAAARAGAKGGTREALVRSEGRRNLFDQLGNIQATGLQNAFQQAQAQAAQDAAMRAQYGLAGAQLGEASRQFGAGLGMQGIGQQLAAAGTLGGLGQQEYGQRMGINQAQLGAGTQIQSLGQQDLASRYQQFLNEQQLPFQQLGFFSDILRGTPSSAAIQQRYQAPPSLGGMIGGLGLAGLGSLYGGLGS